MRIAYLILAHTDVKQLNRLLKQLCEMQDVYLHVDQKADFSIDEINDYSSLYILTQRTRCYWGDISLVEATLLLYRAALQKKYDRYVLLSGQDYPLYAQKDLQTYFAKHADVEFIRGFAITDKNQDYFKIQQRHFMKPFFHNKKTDRFLHHLLRYGITKNRLFYKKTDLILQGQTYTVYGGGQWHALTHAFASYMMDLIDTQPKLLTYFQTSYAPDEMLFQTILFNSPFRDHTFKKGVEAAYVDDIHRWTALHVMKINAYGEVSPYSNDDYAYLKASEALFFLKAVSGISDTLIDRLEEEFYAASI